MAFRQNRRRLIGLAMAFVVLLVYLWQLVSAWQVEQDQYALRQRAGIIWRGEGVHTETALVSGATAILHANSRADTGELLVQNLPMLPPAEIYQLWGIDATGTVDAAADFSVPFDSEGTFVVRVIAPQFLTTYTRFFITIESANRSHPTPSGRVVMTN